MSFNSQTGQVVLVGQPVKGVPNTAALPDDGISIKLTSGALAGNRELLIPDPEMGGSRDTTDAYLGPVNFAGDYEMYVRFRAIAFLLAKSLGTVVSAPTTAGAGAHTHTITPVDGNLPYVTVYEEISNDLERFLYTDAVVNTFHLEVDAGGYMTATAGMIARIMTANATNVDGLPIQDNTSMVVGTNVEVFYDNVKVPAKAFSLDVDNTTEDDDYRLGSFFMGDMTSKERVVTASMTLRHEDNVAMRTALFGGPAATQIGGITTKKELKIVASSYEDIPGTVGEKFKIEIVLPKVIFAPFAFEPSGSDPLENDVEMTAVRPSNAVPILTAKVTNDVEAIV